MVYSARVEEKCPLAFVTRSVGGVDDDAVAKTLASPSDAIKSSPADRACTHLIEGNASINSTRGTRD